MGFLKFLKREKKESLDDLDLPPAPPPLDGDQTDFGAYGSEENLPDLPEMPDFPEEKISAPEEFPKFEFPREDDKMPEFPTFPEMEEKPTQIHTFSSPPMSEPAPMPTMPSAPQPMQEPEQGAREEPRFMPLDAYPKMERRLFSQEKRILRERPTAKTIYVRVDRFKATLGSINMVRSDLRKSEEALTKLESIKNSKDISLDKFKASLDDLQKKLIFVDKTLFKGD